MGYKWNSFKNMAGHNHTMSMGLNYSTILKMLFIF